MLNTGLRFLAKEAVLVALVTFSIVPAFMAGVATDVASIQLFALAEDPHTSLPYLSSSVARAVGGYHGFPQVLSQGCWFFTMICFQLCAFTSKSSAEFRSRFLPLFLLTWVIFAAFVCTVWAAAVLPRGLLLTRIDTSWLSIVTTVVVLAELIAVAVIPIAFVLQKRRRGSVR